MNLKKKKVKKIKVIYRKLAREKVEGWAHLNKDKIEIDERLVGRKRLRVLVHELTHLAFESATESEVLNAERIIGNTLWQEGFRKVDN